MALVLTQEGARELWQWILGVTPPTYPNLHLLGSAYSVVHTTTEALLLPHELTGGGYAPIALISGSAWSLALISQGCQASRVAGPWNLTLPTTIYGYWLADQTDTYSLWGESFASPYSYDPLGGPFYLSLLPQLVSLP
jgi:hypothetical protein